MKTLRKIICILAVPMLLSAQNAFAQEREETSFPSKWIFGKDHKYSSVYQTFRLSEPVAEGHMKVRLRAIGKEIVKKGEEESTAGLMLVPQGYVGAYAQNLGTAVPEDTLKVLCLGNSFTYYHSCPSMLKELAWNEGHYIDMYASLKGSRSMADHLDLEMTNELIALGGYDYVFLQDWSHMATLVGRDKKKYSGRIADMAAGAEKVRTTSPGCKAVVEWTWAYPYMDFAGLGSFRKFHSKSRKGVNLLSRAVGEAVISPIENAFRIVREERPDIEMYHTDRHHQSIYGSYLKSCVNYLVIYGEPYGSNPADCSLPEDIAAYLRSVAERVVL